MQILDARGRPLTGEATRERVRALAIPPAWSDVWICPSEHGHIQATGIDGAGRRQYIYHEGWTASRSRAKFRRMELFAVELDALREAVEADLDPDALTRASVVAGLVRLLDLGFFRVGSERYAAKHRTFGLTTLLREHATVRRDGTIVFDYTAKHGKRRVERVGDDAVGALVTRLKRRRTDRAPRLFSANEEARWSAVRAEDVNGYLREATGVEITAKDFRTWNATVLAAALLAGAARPGSRAARDRVVAGMIREVSTQLGNTPAVCRASYVDPRVVDRWTRGQTIDVRRGELATDPGAWTAADRRVLELAVVELLELPPSRRPALQESPPGR